MTRSPDFVGPTADHTNTGAYPYDSETYNGGIFPTETPGDTNTHRNRTPLVIDEKGKEYNVDASPEFESKRGSSKPIDSQISNRILGTISMTHRDSVQIDVPSNINLQVDDTDQFMTNSFKSKKQTLRVSQNNFNKIDEADPL
jgi:hypothetical protein